MPFLTFSALSLNYYNKSDFATDLSHKQYFMKEGDF